MTKWLFLSLSITFLMLSGCAKPTDFTSSDGAFTITCPSGTKPTVYSNVFNDQVAGPLTNNHVWMNSSDLTYTISYWDYPEGYFDRNNAAKTIDDIIVQMKANFKDDARLKDGTFLNEQKTTIDGFDGREFEYAYGLDQAKAHIWIMKVRYYLVKQRMYMLFGDGLKEHTEDIDKFINGFKLIKKWNIGKTQSTYRQGREGV